MQNSQRDDEMSARIERLLAAQPTAPPEARRVRRAFEIKERWVESRRHLGVAIEVDAEFAESFRRPGQYVTLKTEGWPARFYVIASRPEPNLWEFLIDRSGELGPVLADLEVGERVELSFPEGGGFDASEAAQKTAMLFCTGSAIATMRPLIESWLGGDHGRPDEIVLYYGERKPDDFAYEEMLAQWEATENINIFRAVEERSSEQYPYRYVQDAFDAHPVEVQNGYAYLSGAPVMVQMVAQRLLKMGAAPSRLRINI